MAKSSFEYPQEFYGNYHSQKPICGVLALAIAADISFAEANEKLKEAMHKVSPSRQRFCGPSTNAERDYAMEKLGVEFKEIPVSSLGARTMKLKDICAKLEPGKLYHINTPKHISTFRNGFLIDQGRNKPVDGVSFKEKRVSRILEIVSAPIRLPDGTDGMGVSDPDLI